MNRIVFISISLILFIGTSCKKGPTKAFSDKVLNNDFEFEYFSTKAKVDYIDSEQNISTPIQIRIKQDSAIWMSVTPALGIEMMRILITQDSVFMLNRLKKEYYAGSFEFVKEKLGLNVNYKLVEKLMIGDIPLKSTSSQKITKTDSHYILEQLLKDFTITNSIKKDISRLDKLQLKGNSEDIDTKIYYSDFTPINDVEFAQNVKLNQVYKGKKTDVDIKYTKVKVSEEPLNLSFSIPSNYNEIKLK